MRRLRDHQSGQTAVEFALILTALIMLTAGLIDAGRGFYANSAVAAAARYGARWGGVVGQMCGGHYTFSDWCRQLGSGTSTFWGQPGNLPLQGSATCPTAADDPTFSGYYSDYNVDGSYQTDPTRRISTYNVTTATTIVGATIRHFDTNTGSSSFIVGGLTPGIDYGKLKICIQMPDSFASGGGAGSIPAPSFGDQLTVYVYYPFKPVSPILSSQTLRLYAASSYVVE